MTGIELLVAAAPAAAGAGVVALTTMGVYNEWKRRKARLSRLQTTAHKVIELKNELPAGAVWVQHGAIPKREGLVIEGTSMYVSAGTVGAKRLLDALFALSRVGLGEIVGSILFFECDTRTRQAILAALPKEFGGRVVFASAPEYPDGFGNMGPDEVEEQIGGWGVPLLGAIAEVIAKHEELNGGKPGEIAFFGSLGGHAYPGLFLVQELHECMPRAQILGVINLPTKEPQRAYFAALKGRYEDAGVMAWLLSDQMEGDDYITQDSVVADIFAGITAASLGSDSSLRTNNVVRSVVGTERGGIARFEFVVSEVIAHPHQPDPAKPPVGYYVFRNELTSETRRSIELIESGKGEVSIAAPVGDDKRHTYDLALCAISPTNMLDVRDYIEQARKAEVKQLSHKQRPHLHSHINYETVYATWSPQIDPEHPRCRILVVRLRALSTVTQHLSELVKAPQVRTFASLAPVPVIEPSTNGVAASTDYEKF